MAKDLLELKWIEELLPSGFLRKHMFGGFTYYVDERMVLALFESENNQTHNGIKYDFELWRGCLFPCDRENHAKIINQFPFLFPHPFLSKWLYLPLDSENFESNASQVLKEIRRRSDIFGVIPKLKNRIKKKTKSKKKTSIRSEKTKTTKSKKRKTIHKIDFKTPKMFS